MDDRATQLEELYAILDDLRARVGGFRRLGDCVKATGWPERGVYFFFDDSEPRASGSGARVVRVGTHGVSAGSKSTLWGRLSQHRGHVGGGRPGGGKHRGSVFRLHVGAALLERDGYEPAVEDAWARKKPARETLAIEAQLERAVSEYICRLPFLWVDVEGESDKGGDRARIEANAIALLSNRNRQAIDPPSPEWLGRHARRPAIRESGLWNVRHVDEAYDPGFLDVLRGYVARM